MGRGESRTVFQSKHIQEREELTDASFNGLREEGYTEKSKEGAILRVEI